MGFTANPGYCSVYYQLLQETRRIPCKSSPNGNDAYTGRILAQRLAPNYTIENVKRHVCNLEALDISRITAVYTSESESPTSQDSSIFSDSGEPSGTVWRPLIIIVKNETTQTQKRQSLQWPKLYNSNSNSQLEPPAMSPTELNMVATFDKPAGWTLAVTTRSSAPISTSPCLINDP